MQRLKGLYVILYSLQCNCPPNRTAARSILSPPVQRLKGVYPKVSNRAALPIEPPRLYSEVIEAILSCKTLFTDRKSDHFWLSYGHFCVTTSCNLLQPPHTTAYLPGGCIRDLTVCYMYDMFETERQFARFYIPCQHTSVVVVLTLYFCVCLSESVTGLWRTNLKFSM